MLYETGELCTVERIRITGGGDRGQGDVVGSKLVTSFFFPVVHLTNITGRAVKIHVGTFKGSKARNRDAINYFFITEKMNFFILYTWYDVLSYNSKTITDGRLLWETYL